MPAGSNNRWSQDWALIFNRIAGSDNGSYSGSGEFDEDWYVLNASSPAKNGGFDAADNPTDAGIYGGEPAYRYKLSGVPSIPAIYKLNLSNPATTANRYTVIISARSNNASNITRMEYYIDEEPGFGAGTSLGITAGKDIQNIVLPINPAPFSEGIHRL